MRKIKVLTLNTHSWLEQSIDHQVNELAKEILQGDYAVVALQEVNQPIEGIPVTTLTGFQPVEGQWPINKKNFLYLLVEKLREEGAVYFWSWVYNHVAYDRYHEGVGLLSKEPIHRPKALLLSETSDPADYHTRKALLGETSYQGQSFLVVSGHFSWWDSETTAFAHEWTKLEQELLDQDQPFLLMGDFNSPAEVTGEGYDFLQSGKLSVVDSFLEAEETIGEHTVVKEIAGWENNQEGIRIDYVFHTLPVQTKGYRTVFDGENEPRISDHLGVAVHLDR